VKTWEIPRKNGGIHQKSMGKSWRNPKIHGEIPLGPSLVVGMENLQIKREKFHWENHLYDEMEVYRCENQRGGFSCKAMLDEGNDTTSKSVIYENFDL
jgi:hypothetical protein